MNMNSFLMSQHWPATLLSHSLQPKLVNLIEQNNIIKSTHQINWIQKMTVFLLAPTTLSLTHHSYSLSRSRNLKQQKKTIN